MPTGFDLDRNGTIGGGNDAYGFGDFPGQYGMVVLSRYPIDHGPGPHLPDISLEGHAWALLPDDPATTEPGDWYSDEILDVFRLSSKSHWDVPVRIGGRTVHVLASHPTPPTFDGPEDRNGPATTTRSALGRLRDAGRHALDLYDDDGRRGGLRSGGRVRDHG